MRRITVILSFVLLSFMAYNNLRAASNSFRLIDQAFKEGRLDYETSLVQKMFALHNPERLKPEFRSKGVPPMKSGTLLYLEIKQNWDRLSKETQDILWPYLLRPTQAGEDSLTGGYGHSYTTDDTASWATPSGHFRVWYVRSTEDAPDMTDDDQDGVPDWINLVGEILDDVWAYEIDGLRYREPIKDADYSADYRYYGMDYGGDGRFDVYVEDLGSTVFGYTRPELLITPSSTQESLATCYVVIDDDYPESIFHHKPKESLEVTCAHEFFHAIQFAYKCDMKLGFFMEISSVWMEDQVYNDVNDYLNYLPYFFGYPQISLTTYNGRHEYGSCIWGHYLSENYGLDIMRQIWEQIRQGTAATDAFDVILGDYGSNLEDGYQDFTLWNYFTDGRWRQNSYYSEGSNFPEIGICRTHTQFPVPFQQGATGSRPQYLGSNYVAFIPDGRSGGLKVIFDGQNDLSWRATIVGYAGESGKWSMIKQFNLDQGNYGPIQLANWDDFSQIVLIASVVSETEGGGTYSYSATYDSTLNNLPKLKDISIIPNPAHVVQGHKKQFMVEGYDANGEEITAHPNWFNWEVIGGIGIFESPGYFNAVGDTGKGKIVASGDGMVDTALIIVTESPLTRIEVTPDSSPPLAVGTTQQFEATGFDRDSLQIPIGPIWEVKGNAGVIDQNGLFTATKTGSAEIVAKVGLISGSARINVTSPDPILSQSYPNPFKLTKWDKKVYFPFILPEEKGKVSIAIFTVSGERVKEINLGKMERDDYRDKGKAPSWDGKNEAGRTVAEGIYLYRFWADDYTAVKKMAVIRE